MASGQGAPIALLAIEAGIIDRTSFDAGIRAIYRTAEDDGVFCYTVLQRQLSRR